MNHMNNNNMNTNVGITNPSSGAVYTSGTNLQQGQGVLAGAVYTSGNNAASGQTNYNQHRNTNTNINNNITDPNSGAVYTSDISLQQDPGVKAGAVYTSEMNTSGQQYYNQQRNTNNSFNNNVTDRGSGAVYTSNLNSQQNAGVQAGAVYTSGYNPSNQQQQNFNQQNFSQQRNTNTNLNNITDPRSGAVYTSNLSSQQNAGMQAGALNTSGFNMSNQQQSYNQQRNTNNNLNNITDPRSGAVYTSDMQQGPSNTAGINSFNMQSNVATSTMGQNTNAGASNVQQIKQQLQNIQTHLRQPNTTGSVNQVYTDAANKIQDVYEILNNNLQ